MMSIITQGRIPFWMYLLKIKLFGQWTWPTNEYSHRYFYENIWDDLESSVLDAHPFQYINIPQLIKNQLWRAYGFLLF